MSSLVVLLLIAAGALAEVTESTGSSNSAMPTHTDHTPEGKGWSDYPKVMVLQPITTEESSAEPSRPPPIKSVCMMKVNCADTSPIDYDEVVLELQRDQGYQDAPSTVEETPTAATASAGSPKPTPPPVPCTVEIQVLQTYRGQCVRLGQQFGGCRAGPFVSPLQPPCHPPPQQ
ncbi:uncharacterized protein LOC126335519 isoform X1 [Schistocerca gregaria]|uniref:uncharacterized protein LOC126335519 isoform X1 n=1 Tax=Schistocerca gregaria TaxID=7010 RepID=UPI00211EDF34|nr:uncharacterized protein LOC126335519 isoform X1 [Schistocerca gregaria]